MQMNMVQRLDMFIILCIFAIRPRFDNYVTVNVYTKVRNTKKKILEYDRLYNVT